MPVRILCIGDPHFTEDSVREMDLFVNKTLDLIDKLLKEPEGLDLVVDLGDTLDKHERIHIVCLTQAMKFLHEISLRVPLVILIGNHDRENNSVFLTEESPFWACHWWNNTTVVDIPKALDIKNKDNGKEGEVMENIFHKFTFIPYVYPGRFKEALDRVSDWKESTCIFAHQEIRGCSLGGIKSTNGDLWSSDLPLLISGHIHEYEVLDNVIYVGTPRMKTFGDGRKKTVSLFTFDKGKSNENSKEERIDLGLPKKTTLHVTMGQLLSTTNFLTVNEDLTGTLKIFIEGTSSEIKVGMKHPIIKHLKKLNVRVVPKVNDSKGKVKSGDKEKIDKKILENPNNLKSDLRKSIWQKFESKVYLLGLLKSLFAKKEGLKLRIQIKNEN